MSAELRPAPVPLRVRHCAASGEVLGIEVLDAPAVSLITRELLDGLDPRYRDGDDIVFTPDVRYRLGEECGLHGDLLLHRVTS